MSSESNSRNSVTSSELPTYGVRNSSETSSHIHRDSDGEDTEPACCERNRDADFIEIHIESHLPFNRWELCQHDECFGDDPDPNAEKELIADGGQSVSDTEHDTYRFDCRLCSTTWNGDDLARIAERAAWHWNKEHNDELCHSYKRIDTVERGGHNVHGNEWTVERIPIYITAFDVMNRIGLEDGMAVPPETGNSCDQCHRFLREYHEHEVVEETIVGNDVWRCPGCADQLETERKQEENQQITEFLTDGGRSARDTEQKVIQTAKCEAPLCEFVAVVEDPEEEYQAAIELAEHYNSEHDEIDRELAADYYGKWDRDNVEPYEPETDLSGGDH